METYNSNFNEVLNSKEFIKPAYTFLSPLQIMNPVLDIFGNDYSGFGSHPVSVGDEGTKLTSYGRVGCIKTFDISEEFSYQVGFIYSLETSKPYIKVFSGVNVSMCSNMCIFNSNNTQSFVIASSGFSGAYEQVKKYITEQSAQAEKAVRIIQDMKENWLSTDKLNQFIGQICRNFQAVRNVAGTNCIMNACSLFENPESIYHVKGGLNCWLVYNAITEYFAEKNHIIDHPDKVLSIYAEMKQFSEKYTQKALN